PCVTADRSGDGHAAAGREDVTCDRPVHLDQATTRDQVTVDRAVDPDGPREGVEVVRDGLARRHGHRVDCSQLVAQRPLGDGNPSQDREQDNARHDCLEQAIATPHRSTLPSQPYESLLARSSPPDRSVRTPAPGDSEPGYGPDGPYPDAVLPSM